MKIKLLEPQILKDIMILCAAGGMTANEISIWFGKSKDWATNRLELLCNKDMINYTEWDYYYIRTKRGKVFYLTIKGKELLHNKETI